MQALNYFGHFLISVSVVSGCVSISAFALSVGVPVDITSFALGLKICTITAGIKKYKSIIKTKMKNHNKVVLLAKTKLNTIRILIYQALINSYINHEKFGKWIMC